MNVYITSSIAVLYIIVLTNVSVRVYTMYDNLNSALSINKKDTDKRVDIIVSTVTK